MIISIFTLQCLILLGIIILLLRRRVIVHPNNEWSTLSENLTREYWNSLVDVEHELFRESLFQLSEKQADDPVVLAKAFQDTADEYYRRAHEMASLNSYGVDPRLHNYAIISSSWISRQAANYQEWSEAIKHDLSDSQEAWLSSVTKGAIKGAIRGYLGDIDAVFGMLVGNSDKESRNEMNFEIARLQHQRTLLEVERIHLNSVRDGLIRMLTSQFEWTFDEAK